MFVEGMGVFLCLAKEGARRVLHPAVIGSAANGLYTAQFEDSSVAPQPGQNALVFFDRRGEFTQQAIRIDAVIEGEGRPTLGFIPAGEPVSAESRQCFRVSTVLANIPAHIGDHPGALVDASASGFAIMSGASHAIGQTLSVSIDFAGERFEGMATVQSAEHLPAGSTRFGLHLATGAGAGRNLKTGLQRVTAEVQRIQLRRRAGA